MSYKKEVDILFEVMKEYAKGHADAYEVRKLIIQALQRAYDEGYDTATRHWQK